MRKVILNLAISLDGRIVDENNNFDWIKGDGNKSNDTKNQFDFDEFVNSCDTLIFGKTAYEHIPVETLEMFAEKKIIVLTRSTIKPERKNVEFLHGDLSKTMQELKEKSGGNIWIWGGSSVCNLLFKKNMIDEYIIGIIPIIVGKGTKLFYDDNPILELSLKECTVNEGIVMLIYKRRNK